MAVRQVTTADVQAVGDADGLAKLLNKLGYDTSSMTEQTAAALGVADKGQAMVRQARRIVAQKAPAGPLPALEIYWFEVTSLTAELRRMLASAFRNKPLLRYLLVLTQRDFSQLDFVLVEKSLAEAAIGAQVAVTHQLFAVDRRHPSRVHLRVINRLANVALDPYAQSDRLRDAFRLAEWSEDAFNNRNLFSDYFLTKRLTEQSLFPIWHGDFKPAYKHLGQVFAGAGDVRSLSETDYLSKFILPMVGGLGFAHSAGKGEGQADYVLKPTKDAPPCAALLVYPWDRPLDRKDEQQSRSRAEDVPGIRIVKVLEEQKLPWAILTNGKDWRLYCAAAHSRATNYYEIDLADALEHEDLIAFRYFYLFFRAESFVHTGSRPALLDQLREGSAAFAKELGDKLRQHIFDDVFPYLAQGFVDYRKQKFDEKTAAGDEFLTETYDATLTLLYRLLFLLYAEALDLVPVNEPAYAELSLSRLKGEVADHAGVDGDTVENKLKARFTKSDTKLYDRIGKLVAVIDAGSKDHNVPTYNGGLFSTAPDPADKSREAEAARFLKKHKVPDFYLARALDLLARGEDAKSGRLEFIDYKSLGVRQLGSVYEGLLMYHVVIPREDWEIEFKREGLKVALVPSNKERKSTGSYFTPQHIVKYIVTQTVGPLLEEKFKAMAPKLRAAQREYHEQKKYDETLAPILRKAEEKVFKKHADLVHELLDVKVLDPAMGSGHFLVETVDFVTDKLLDFIAGFPWNPVQVFVDRRVRGPIVDSLEAQGVKINEDRLTDVNLIKRLVMKRCVYGVDLNPMAVELAKVSVWLDSFTIGAPLSFMDHHFRCGNSLIGSSIADLKKAIADSGSLFAVPTEPLERATKNMELIADLSDATLDEVHRSSSTYQSVLKAVHGYRVLLDCLTAEHFGVEHAASLVEYGGDLNLADWAEGYERLSNADRGRVDKSIAIARTKRFFHWDVDFPDVFFAARRPEMERRFDAVVGNPPYDRLVQDDLGPEVEIDKRYFKTRLQLRSAASKEMNLWRLFVCQVFGLPHPTARLGFIIPLGLLGDDAAEALRRDLLTNRSISAIEAFPQKDDPRRRIFEEAKLSTVVVVIDGDRPDASHVVRVRTHPANIISDDGAAYVERQSVFLRFEPENVPIPRCSELEWKLAIRMAEGADSENGKLCRMVKIARHYEGEVPQKKPLGIFVAEDRGQFVIRGAHIARYSLQDAKQGEELYVSVQKLRRLFGSGDNRLAHVEQRRVVYQEGAPEDNYRRVIPCLIGPGSYVGHTVHYVPESECQLPLECLLAVLGSSLSEWYFDLLSANNHVSQYKVHAFPVPVVSRTNAAAIELARAAAELTQLGRANRELCRELKTKIVTSAEMADADEATGATVFRDVDYMGSADRAMTATPAHEFSGEVVAHVYPSYPFPGIDFSTWEASAWEDCCEFLRKNKTKIANARIRADLTGRGAVTNPTGPMKKLQETFLKFHREIRENRAKAAELDFLIDRIVFKLFDLTLEEQKLILSRVGPGRPLPPRRGRGRRAAGAAADEGPALFET